MPGRLVRLGFLQKLFLVGNVQRAEGSNHACKPIIVGIQVGERHTKCFRQPLRSGQIGGMYALLVPIDACTGHKWIQSSKDT